MDTITLVENQIEDGQKLLDRLSESDFSVRAACWVKPIDEDRWSLYIATPVVDEKGAAQAYREVYRVLRSIENVWITDSDIKLIGETHPITNGLLDILKRSNGKISTRSRRPLLGEFPIEEAYVYPPPETSFEGFSETKRRFPSAEIFTVTIQNVPDVLDAPRKLMGKVNAEEFEGRAPETVFFWGPKGSSTQPRSKLVFVYRPEGWNTFYRSETGSWEKVVYSVTGKSIYEPADFSPLAAMKVAEDGG